MLLFGQEIFFSDPIPVAENTYGNKAPRISLLEDGSPVVYFGKSGANPSLYVVRGVLGEFETPVSIPINNLDVNLWSGELGPQIATFGNTIYVVYEVYGDGIYVSTSTDGGDTWADPVSTVDLAPGRYATLPSIGVDLLGNPIVNFITTNSSEQDALFEVVRSLDGGQTFELPTVANVSADGGEVCECCTAGIMSDSDGDIFLSFRNNDNNIRDIWVAKSDNGAVSFDVATDIDDTDWESFVCPSSGPMSMESGDDLVSVFFSAGGGSSSVYVSTVNRSTMVAGTQWQMPTFTGDAVTQNYPRIAGEGNLMGMVWEENATGSKDVLFAYSESGAADLTSESIVLAGGDFSQRNPDIAYGDGLFHVVYTDQVTNQVMYVQAGFAPFVSTKVIDQVDFNVRLSPNPAKDYFQINLSELPTETVLFSLFDVSGKFVLEGEINQQLTTVSIGDLNTGIYFLEIISGESRSIKKVVLEK